MIGIYDRKDGSLLERCTKKQLIDAIYDWHKLGFKISIGPAFKNLIYLL